MNKQNKILIFGGIGLAVITFFAFKIFSKKPKPLPRIPNRGTGAIFPDEPSTDSEETVLQVKTRRGSRLRSEPSTDSEIIQTFQDVQYMYAFDKIEKSDGLWYRVDDGEFLSGWMRSDVVDVV